jgi:lysophospholipase L1-like esterase
MSALRRLDAAALVVALLVVGGLGAVLWPRATAASPASSAKAAVDHSQPASVAANPATVLFIGDSYTAGNGLPEMSYACQAAVRLGWLCEVSAVPGTGYISGGPANRSVVDEYTGLSTSFIERIPKLSAMYRPDVVVLDGGRNDTFAPRDDVFDAMVATIDEARRAWPKATIVFIRPRFLANPDDDLSYGDSFIAALRAQPGNQQLMILDPLSRFSGESTADLLRSDGIHPNRNGELQLASALLAALTDRGFAVVS